MFERIAGALLAGYAVWHACRARRPQGWAAYLHDLQREQIENQKQILALADQGPAIVAAIAAAVNGDIGGRVGFGFQNPGSPGRTTQF